MSKNPYTVPIFRAQLTRALPQLVPDVHEEIVDAFNEFIPLTDGKIRTSQHLPYRPKIRIDWTGIKALETFTNMICRASNRIFVGCPLCQPSSIPGIQSPLT